MRRCGLVLACCAVLGAVTAHAQRPPDAGTIVVIVGQEASAPVPSIGSGRANQDVADLLFLRLARIGRDLVTSGDRGFIPELARSWSRRDSVTIAFDLDPRARWHDGTPVTARDVTFSFDRARDPRLDPQRALLLRNVAAVTPEGDRRVVVRFARAYAEQLYDATWHVQPLPAHLLDSIPPDRLAASGFVQQPVGNGPYRWVRRDPGQRLELAGDPGFFLGRPRIDRVVLLLARDPEAQLNLILDGTGDALENITPTANVERLRTRPDLRILPVPTFTVGYLLFNQRAYGDRSRPHPVLADRDVRRAIAMALDRTGLVRTTFGDFASVAEGPVAQLHWIRDPGARATRFDPREASALLVRRGWRDSDGDGTLDRDGVPLSLRLNFPAPSAPRAMIAAQVQEQLRRIGIRVELVRLDGPVWAERRGKGEFDIDFSSASMDPSPSGLVQSWSCAGRGGSNVAQYCNPAVDSLLERAIAGRGDARRTWREVIRAINEDAPAVFVYAPVTAMAVHRRYADVEVRPESWWSSLWRWRVRPGERLPRDGSR
ncbi:MAG TPA: peptide ABC transporter substrate-binding protein [Gemmatimonadales bacterium]|nr:peptide ABC transporter substrate-binding protein [Gemmatimonadales bacterium]